MAKEHVPHRNNAIVRLADGTLAPHTTASPAALFVDEPVAAPGLAGTQGALRVRTSLYLLREEARQIRSALQGKQVADHKIFNQALLDLLQLETLCEVAELVAGSALLREESRGHHYRSDFPRTSERWLCHTSVVRDGGTAQFKPKPL